MFGIFLVQNSFQATIFYSPWKNFQAQHWFRIWSIFKMRGCTMRVPLKLTSYTLKSLISGGGRTLRYAIKYFISLQGRHAKTYFTIFRNKKLRSDVGPFGHPVSNLWEVKFWVIVWTLRTDLQIRLRQWPVHSVFEKLTIRNVNKRCCFGCGGSSGQHF